MFIFFLNTNEKRQLQEILYSTRIDFLFVFLYSFLLLGKKKTTQDEEKKTVVNMFVV